MKIIFDYNRTLYNPEENNLYPGVIAVLTELKQSGHDLHLLSAIENDRSGTIDSLGLRPFFTTINLVGKKTVEEFARVVGDTPKSEVIAIGDKIRGEINIANQLNLITIWVKQGKYAHILPETPLETPDYTVTNIAELPEVIGGW